jgi:hypothetical protein
MQLTSGNSVIDKYNLSDDVLRMRREGKNLREIADALCEDERLMAEGVTVSHTAVANWVNRERKANEELTRSVVEEELRGKAKADLGVLDFLVEDLVEEYLNGYETIEDLGLWGTVRKNAPLPFERKVQIANAIRQLIGDRLKLAGLGDGAGGVADNLGELMREARERVDAAERGEGAG